MTLRKDTITEQIQCSYAPEEMATIAKGLAAAIAEVETIEEEKKESNSAFKARIDEQTAAINDAARKYKKGYEVRDVLCDIRYNDPAPGQKSIYRMDTKELVRTVEMTWEEKQEEIQFNLTEQKVGCLAVRNEQDCRSQGLALDECCEVCRTVMEAEAQNKPPDDTEEGEEATGASA